VKGIAEIVDLFKQEYGIPEIRERGSPLESLIQVILSQNTNDKNRDRAWKSLQKKFDSVEEIMEADVEKISEAISMAGLHNIKADRIKGCLEKIMKRRGKLDIDFLENMDTEEAKNWLTGLPGIGPKSAAVVLNFNFGKETFPVDTHVFRVTKRLGLIPKNSTRKKAHEILEEKVPGERKQEFHINLIRHGRRTCKARKPLCNNCNFKQICNFYKKNKKSTPC